jgi:hypothetical protein
MGRNCLRPPRQQASANRAASAEPRLRIGGLKPVWSRELASSAACAQRFGTVLAARRSDALPPSTSDPDKLPRPARLTWLTPDTRLTTVGF